MCGISGFITTNYIAKNLDNESIVLEMLKKISHRGPDSIGKLVNEKNKVIFGHNRLIIQDLSDFGSQPMNSISNRFLISFNGEIYNHFEIRNELNQISNNKIVWKSSSDTCTLVNCFEFWDISIILKKIVGMFSFALFDKKLNKVYIVRDRFGEKPLFYQNQNNKFFFSSELKSFKISSFANIVNKNTFNSYFKFGYIPEPETIYKNIYKLEKGCFIELDICENELKFSKKKYFSLKELLGNDNFYEKKLSTEDMLTQAVKRVHLSDAPLGVFLSSGVDSSLILAISSAKLGKKISSFTLGYEFDGYNEVKKASRIARHLNSDHEQIIMSNKDVVNCIYNINHTFDEPFSDHSAISNLFLSQVAKKSIKVALSGDGSDEQFFGYRRYKKAFNIYKFTNLISSSLRNKICSILKNFSKTNKNLKINNIERYLRSSNDIQLFYNEILRINSENILANSQEDKNLILEDFNNDMNLDQYMMFHDISHYLTNDILVKTDRTSMANGLEVRLPFLDIDLVKYNLSGMFKQNYKNDISKNSFKQILKKYLPDELINKNKIGFGAPVDYLFKSNLKTWVEDLLSKNNLNNNGFANPEIIQANLKDHLSGKRNYRDAIWNLVVFQNWMKENA